MLGLKTTDDYKKPTDHNSILIQLASPDTIREWSYGEVTKPETINYRTFKPEKDGLFCERIFGPVKDWECNCGKYKRIRFRGIVCDKCGVEVTQSKVRRERLGHIELAVPIAHIWFFKGLPSRIGHLLDMKLKDLERVLYYESFTVLDNAGDEASPLAKYDLVTHEELEGLFREQPHLETEFEFVVKDEFGKTSLLMGTGSKKIVLGEGGGAIRDILADMNLPELSIQLKTQIKEETSVQRKKSALKRLKIVEAIRNSGNRPEWMILDCAPVLPPDLRPLVPLDGGRFATSDLNDLYRRVINRNNRLKKLIEIKAPGVILRNEKRMLQEAVDALFDNGRRSRAVKGQGNRPLKSLSDMLKGKKGRFRQNLLGKRVDYSGRSVIVVGPELKLYQCGLPKTMALELFKPFIIRQLEEEGYVQTVKSAKKLVEQERPEVWDILEGIIQDHPVLLNRAPTLHRLGIQAFEPVLVEGKAIRVHPLVCTAFNADFDGDQMAVHVPLGYEAQIEARVLMLSPNNILSPASGAPIATPSQDMVLGCYYLTLQREGAKGEGKAFSDLEDALAAFRAGIVAKHALIMVRFVDDESGESSIVETTAGRILFNEVLPDGLPFANSSYNKKELATLVGVVHKRFGTTICMQFLDRLKELGFHHATEAGITIGIDDIQIPAEKKEIIAVAQKKVDAIVSQHSKGIITNRERYNKVIDLWTQVSDDVRDRMFENLSKDDQGFNSVYMMNASGARGSADQIKQLAGMRGLMAKPQKKVTGGFGEIIEQPIISNFREGLSVLEYFISTHGARKGLADTALKTADAGYLTRRLVDVAQDVVVTEDDCGTLMGLEISSLKEGEKTIESLKDRIVGRAAAEDVIDEMGEIICENGQLIDVEVAERIEEAGVESLRIRSILTCRSKRGVCAHCFGYNLAEDKLVDIGEPVGVMAAQAIGEPGTQLTLRTFHIGGTASRTAVQNVKTAAANGNVQFHDCEMVLDAEKNRVAVSRKGEIHLVLESGVTRSRMSLPYGAKVLIKDSQKVEQGTPLFEWDPFSDFILSEKVGVVDYIDIIDGVTLSVELDEKTRMKQPVIKEPNDKTLHPSIRIVSVKTGRKLAEYIIPNGAFLQAKNGQKVRIGDKLAKIPREISQTGDITGGLPRVAELFEARKPRDAAIITEIDGAVHFRGTTRGLRRIVVEGEDGMTEKEYLIPHGRHIRTYEGERVLAGDRLTEGPINPMDILTVKGVKEVQSYLVNAIQEVYRLQGVKINDKHIEVVVSRMLQKVQILEAGDTEYMEDMQVIRKELEAANEKIVLLNKELRKKGEPLLEPATSEPLLLGITKASLSTDSFISAASFQETTRVLTDAATRSKRDELRSLKENVIMGHLISAGTGMTSYRTLAVEDPTDEIEDPNIISAIAALELAAQQAELEPDGDGGAPEAVSG